MDQGSKIGMFIPVFLHDAVDQASKIGMFLGFSILT